MNEGRKSMVEALAWDLVACAQRPPLHPTTCAVMRILAVFRVVPFSVFAAMMPCDLETTRQQLRRLQGQGLVERHVVQPRGRHAVCIYALTPCGWRMVEMWGKAKTQLLQTVNHELSKLS